MKIFFCISPSLQKGVKSGVGSGSVSRSGVGSGSGSQRYGFADPRPQQNVTDPQHWLLHFKSFLLRSIHAQLSAQLLRLRIKNLTAHTLAYDGAYYVT